MTTVCAIVATYGDPAVWEPLAARAFASCGGFDDVLVVHEDDGKLHEVRNRAAHAAETDWLVFVDGDDRLELGYGGIVRAAISEHGSGTLLTPRVEYRTPRGGLVTASRHLPRVAPEDGNWLVIGTAVEREAFLWAGGFKGWPIYEDWCLWARLQQAGYRPVPIDATYIATARPESRNRWVGRRERVYWHQTIGRSLYPHLYDAPTDDDHARQRMSRVRRIA